MAVFTLILILCGVKWSEGVSVQVTASSGEIPLKPELSLDSIESLVSSKIMMDSISSPPKPTSVSSRLKVTGALAPPSTKVLPSNKGIAAVVSVPMTKKNIANTGSKVVGENEDVRSPLHVAQCRATCLDKFNPLLFLDKKMYGLPNIHRLKRRKRAMGRDKFSSNFNHSCLKESSDCFSCWKSCQLLEMSESKQASSSSATACSNKKNCLGGCQIACSFYENLLAKTAGISITGSNSEPVIATKHENVVQIIPGKITWPMATSEGPVSPVVYVVIQEYPDRKWRQIAQTTDLELDIPAELTGAMKAKLRSVRVLVVGPEGLQSVYSPSEDNAVPEPNKVSLGKLGKSAVVTSNEEASTTATEKIPATTSSDSESDVTQVSPEESGTMPAAPESLSTDISSTTASTTTTSTVVPPFELRLVSLIHQKSLVIAELRWDDVGGNPNQEYLITWELTGGGLKGHLVTDSTSVTLSLWPDTTYQIQVAQFHQNLDSDGEQPAENSESSTFVKSLPLIVDTSVASFPLHPPSALLSSKSSDEEDEDEADSYPHDQDEFSAEIEEDEDADDDLSDHKSIGQVLYVAFAALVLVLLLLTLVACAWIKLRTLSFRKSCVKAGDDEFGNETGNGGCFSTCFTGWTDDDKDASLLVMPDENDSSSEFYSSPLYYVLSLKSGEYGDRGIKNSNMFQGSSLFQPSQQKCSGQQNGSGACEGVPVAVISNSNSLLASSSTRAASTTGGDSYCYYNNVFNFQHHQSSSDLPFSCSSAPSTNNCSS